jgi:Ca2+-binding RTX toxin-like protein
MPLSLRPLLYPLVAVALFASWAPSAADASGGFFGPPTNFPVGGDEPLSVAAADFDSDSDPDLAVTGGDTLSILLGGAGGGFGAPATIDAGSGERTVSVGEFNGDSDPDLAVTNSFAADVSVLLGGAGASFSAPAHFAVESPFSATVGHLNSDSDPDLAVANTGHNTVSILLGAAAGSFTGATSFSTGPEFSFPRAAAIGDFDADSDSDLAVANYGSAGSDVAILLGDGSGSFSAPTHFPVAEGLGGATSIAAGDFNGDSDPDLAVAADNCCLSILLGTAGGTFTAPNNMAAGLAPGAVAVGNFTSDSDPDLAVANGASNDVSILLGAAGGGFTDATNFPSGAGGSPRSLTIGDFNSDADPDIAVANLYTDDVSILLGATPPAPEVRISIRNTHYEGNAGTTTYTFGVTRSGYVDAPSTVNYTTVDGTATAADGDFVPASGVVTFASNETSKTIQVTVPSDLKVESDEQFSVKITAGSNATIPTGQGGEGFGEILNDDLSASAPCTVTGTKGNDTLSGGGGNEVICGLGGDDHLISGPGNDVMIGGNGNDLLEGNENPDLLIGGGGNDDLRGGDGNDTLRGEGGSDTLLGGVGSDALFGNVGIDTLNASDGVSANDSADGGTGRDQCSADAGDFLTACP